MPDPINYKLDVQAPLASVMQGFSAANTISDTMRKNRELQLAEQAKQQALEQQKQQMDALHALANNPNPTAADYAKVSMFFPKDQAASIRASWDMMDKENQDHALKFSGEVYSALNSGNTDVAVDMLHKQAEALRNTPGKEGQADYFDRMAEIAKINPDMAKLNFGTNLSLFPGGDKVIDSVAAMGKEQRAQELQPGELAKQNAEIKKYAADLNLTDAQTKNTLALAGKTSAETKKLMMDMEASKDGKTVLPPQQASQLARSLGNDYAQQAAPYLQVQDSYRKIQAAEDNAAGDLSLIFSYMKMLDPGSSVMEGDFANAQNATGVPGVVRNMYNKALEGRRLNADQRLEFKSQSVGLLKAAKKREEEVRARLGKIADHYSIDQAEVFPDVEPTPPAAGGANAPSGAASGQVKFLGFE